MKKKLTKQYDQYTLEDIKKYRKAFVVSSLRRASYRWPWRNIAMKNARIERGIYECKACGNRVKAKEKQLDHINSVVNPERGFEGWNGYIERLLPGTDGFSVLCRVCHASKTTKERERRKAVRLANTKRVLIFEEEIAVCTSCNHVLCLCNQAWE